MNKVFWKDPYQTSLMTTVFSVSGSKLLFKETIAYSFAGGQESDKATVNDIPILNSMHDGNLIYYFLPEEHGLKEGDSVMMTIDWSRRHRLMRLHFAAEIILEIVTQKFGFQKIGAHIAEDKSRIDFISDKNIADYFDEILSVYNTVIQDNKPIQKGYLDEKNHRRYWKIDGFAQVPCGGTHVNTTGEVGFVTLKRDNRGKSKERIVIRLVDASVPDMK